MASLNDSSSRRRPGRRRLPPLEPGPALHFVVANHPDQFRAGKIMRHVRSHVMYKHRTGRKSNSDRPDTNLSASADASRAVIPLGVSNTAFLSPTQARTRSGTWSGPPSSYALAPSPLRILIHQLLSSPRGTHARSAPPVFEDAPAFPFPGVYTDTLSNLQAQYIDLAPFFSHDRHWMHTICSNPISFLSHISTSSVYQDLADGLGHDSDTTVRVKTYALSAIAGRLESSDATILGILHLLLSEVGGDDGALKVHFSGLMGLVERRGGFNALSSRLGAYLGGTLTTLSALGILPFPVPVPSLPTGQTNLFPSPLYAPNAEFTRLQPYCTPETLALVADMHTLTQCIAAAIHPFSMQSVPSRLHDALAANCIEQGESQRTEEREKDWTGKAIRLASQLFLSLLNTTHAHADSQPPQNPPARHQTLHALILALQRTYLPSRPELRGVLLWTCLVGTCSASEPCTSGASFNPTERAETAFARRFFALWAVRCVVASSLEESGVLVEGVRVWAGVVVRCGLGGGGSGF